MGKESGREGRKAGWMMDGESEGNTAELKMLITVRRLSKENLHLRNVRTILSSQ